MRMLGLLLGWFLVVSCASAPPPPPAEPIEPPLDPAASSEAPPGSAETPTAAPEAPSPARPKPPKKPAGPTKPPAAEPPPATAAGYTGPEPCKLAVRGDSPVAQACREGGIKSARVTMKDLVRRGKAAGLTLNCDDCHMDADDYSKLTNEAKDQFAKLLAATR